MSNLNQGSVWRKWDLHVHTPASFHWNDGKKFKEMNPEEKNEALKRILGKMNSIDVAVFSVMDYFTFDGVLEIRKYSRENTEDTLKKTLLPGVELRIDAPVDYRLNIHAIFSEKVTDQELSDFKAKLVISGLNRSLSDEAIIAAGKSLPTDKAKTIIGDVDYKNDDQKAYELGMKTIKITRESLFEAAKILTKEKCLIILPYDTSDGVDKLDWKAHPHDDCYFLKGADIFETRNKDNVDLFLGRITERNKTFQAAFLENMGGRAKPVVSGSDAHKVNDYGVYPSGKATWIKADPCFKGLIQATIEPSSRTFIGEMPDKLKITATRTTKFIQKIEIKKKADTNIDEIWFNNSLHLNPELIAVIGNKGSGKSALADITGLLGNTKQEDAFSFLNEKKFRERQGIKANKFFANLHWLSNDSISKTLSDSVDQSAVETVKYIPQSYLEKLCNEISSEKSLFDKELKTVIFSHIDQDKRIGRGSLDDLISYKTEEANTELKLLRDNLSVILEEIISNENKLTDQYKQAIVNQLTAKQSELEAHNKNKPIEVQKPATDATLDEAANKRVAELGEKQVEEQKLNKEIEQKTNELGVAQKKIASVQKVISQAELIEKQYSQSFTQIEPSIKELGLDASQIFNFKLDKSPLSKLLTELKDSTAKIEKDLNPDEDESLINKRFKVQQRIKEISEQIDEPNKKYQKYLEDLEQWNKTLASIQGNVSQIGSITSLNTLLSEISNVPTKIQGLEEKRDQKVQEIFSKITALAEVYKQFYAPVQNFVKENPFGDDTFKMSFDVAIVDSGFRNKFFQYINRNRAGTFNGVDESEKKLSKIFDGFDFNKPEDVGRFTREILTSLKFDCRDEKRPPVSIANQLKDGTVLDMYRFVFSLDYLTPRYFLKLNGKSLEQLSPGERGTLLLIFYLMVDKDERPLVIDQPEENLDNQTIFKVLVPCIKKAKQHRQILLVTHNPNLAVVCDAEQVVVASIDKANGNRVNYVSGSIENEEINRQIIDVLEGTRPAFENRDSKYHPITAR